MSVRKMKFLSSMGHSLWGVLKSSDIKHSYFISCKTHNESLNVHLFYFLGMPGDCLVGLNIFYSRSHCMQINK